MKEHNGMRPQDIVVLLKIIILDKLEWRIIDLARQLYISQSEVSEALNVNLNSDWVAAPAVKVKAVISVSTAAFISAPG